MRSIWSSGSNSSGRLSRGPWPFPFDTDTWEQKVINAQSRLVAASFPPEIIRESSQYGHAHRYVTRCTAPFIAYHNLYREMSTHLSPASTEAAVMVYCPTTGVSEARRDPPGADTADYPDYYSVSGIGSIRDAFRGP